VNRLASKFLLFLVSLCLSVVASETVLRIIGRFRPPRYPPVCSRPELYQKFEPHGYRLWPSRTTTYSYPKHNPRTLTVRANSDGFRDGRNFSEADGRLRIVVVGDSFVFGEGVEESERFTNVLETIRPNWRVDSLGMPGYGPDLMLRALEEVGVKSRPDVVIFSMYTDVFRRVHSHYAGAGFEIPRYQLEDGRLVMIPYPKPRAWDWLNLVVLARRIYWQYTSAGFDLNKAILDRFLEVSRIYSFKPAFTFLPGTSDTHNDKTRRAWLHQYAERAHIPFMDLSGPIHRQGPRAFIEYNAHYNPLGHQLVASELRRFIDREFLRGK